MSDKESKKNKRESKHHTVDQNQNDVTTENFHFFVDKGVDLLWNNKYEEAEKFFAPNRTFHPRFSLHYAEVPSFRSYITESEKDRRDAMDRLSETVQLAEQHLKEYEKGKFPLHDWFSGGNEIQHSQEKMLNVVDNFHLDTKIALADAYTMLAAFQVLGDNKLKGAFNLRRGWKWYEHTLKEITDNPSHTYDPHIIGCLKFGAGLFYLVTSLIPQGLAQKAAAMIGFKFDKEYGLQLLRESYAANCVRSHLAGILLAVNHLVLAPQINPDPTNPLFKEADCIIEKGVEVYPKGSMFHLVGGLCMIEQTKIDLALDHLHKSIQNSNHITKVPPMFYRVLCNCYLMKRDWESAAKSLETIVNDAGLAHGAPWAYAWHALKLGAVYIMMGKEEEAKELFTSVTELKSTDEWTVTIKKLAAKFLRCGANFAAFEVMALSNQLDKMAAQMNQTEMEAFALQMDAIAKKCGVFDKVPADKLEKKHKGGMLSFFSLGYYGNPDDNEPIVDNRAGYLLFKASTLKQMGKYDDALNLLLEITKGDLKHHFYDKLYYALALIECGKCHVKKNGVEEALKYFHDALQVSGFPCEDPLHRNVRNYMNLLGVKSSDIHVQHHDADNLNLSDEEKET